MSDSSLRKLTRSVTGIIGAFVDAVYMFFDSLICPDRPNSYYRRRPWTAIGSGSSGSSGGWGGSGSNGGWRGSGPRIATLPRTTQRAPRMGCAGGMCSG